MINKNLITKYILTLNKWLISIGIFSIITLFVKVFDCKNQYSTNNLFGLTCDFALTFITTLSFYIVFEHKKNIDHKEYFDKYVSENANNLIHNNYIMFLEFFEYNSTQKRFQHYYPNKNEIINHFNDFNWLNKAPLLLTPNFRRANYVEYLEDSIKRNLELINNIKNRALFLHQDLELFDILIQIEKSRLIFFFNIDKHSLLKGELKLMLEFVEYIDILYKLIEYLDRNNLLREGVKDKL